MRYLPFAAAILAMAACGSEPRRAAPSEQPQATPEPSGPPLVQQAERETKEPASESGDWKGVADGIGIDNPDGTLGMSIVCTGRPARLVVKVPSFTPIGSEDRFALALGQEPVTLVADPTRQPLGAGVTAEGAAPQDFAELLANAGQVRALYGTQEFGPHSLPQTSAAALAKACGAP